MLLVYYDDDYLFDRRSTPLNGYARNELTYQLRTIPAAAAAAVFLQRGFFIFLCYLQARKIIHQKNQNKMYIIMKNDENYYFTEKVV